MDHDTLRPRPTMLPRVIVASDDPERRAALADALGAMDFPVHEAHEGRELATLIDTLVVFGSVEPIAIVTDRLLPGYDALDLVGALRRVTQATPVVLLDNARNGVTEARAEALGIELLDRDSSPDDVVTALLAAMRAPRSTKRPPPFQPRAAW